MHSSLLLTLVKQDSVVNNKNGLRLKIQECVSVKKQVLYVCSTRTHECQVSNMPTKDLSSFSGIYAHTFLKIVHVWLANN